MRLPTGWKKIAAGHYLHGETHTTIINTWGGKKLGEWWICIPPARKAVIDPAAEGKCPVITDSDTLAEAIDRAEEQVIPRTRAVLLKAWNEALWDQTGTPETWTEGQADEKTVDLRFDGVSLAGRGNGVTARHGDLVKHIELGTVAVFDHYKNGCAWARFAFDAETTLVHPGDLVVLEGYQGWFSCNRIDLTDHDGHGQAVTPECLTALPDAILYGHPLIQDTTNPRRHHSQDGVDVTQHADGTWWAYGPSITGIGVDGICSGQKTLAATHRPINRWRFTRAAQQQIIAAYARLTAWRGGPVRLAEIHEQLVGVRPEDYQWAVIRLWIDTHGALDALADGDVTARDTAAAVTPPERGPQHMLTLGASTLRWWAETQDDAPAVGGRPVFWRSNAGQDQLTYRDTGRPVDEPMPTYVILHVITDRVTYAAHLAAEARTGNACFRADLLAAAARVRSGAHPDRETVEDFRNVDDAWRYAVSLRRHHGGPEKGRTFELAKVTDTGACAHCHHPVIEVDGIWRHKTGGLPFDCRETLDGQDHTAAPRPPTGPVAKPADPPSAAAGNLTFERDAGEHVWRLEGFGCNSVIPGWAVGTAKVWAAEAINAGNVAGVPAGVHVLGWTHRSDGAAQWAEPVLGLGPGPVSPRDRDHRDRDRDHPDHPTPAMIARSRSCVVPVRPGVVRIETGTTGTGTAPTGTGTAPTGTGTAPTGTGTAPTGTGTAPTGTGTAPVSVDRDHPRRAVPGPARIRYLIEKRTGTTWTEVQTGTAPHFVPVPGPVDLENVADSIKGNVGFAIGTGTAAPDVPVRISTWSPGLPVAAVLIVEPSR